MKKKINYYAIMLFCVTSMSSCYKNMDDEKIINNSKDESSLVNQLSILNDSLMSTRVITRAFVKPGWERRAKIIGADIGGAVAGGRTGFGIGGLFGPQAAIGCATIGALVSSVCSSASVYEATRAVAYNNPTLKERTICAYENSLIENVEFKEYTPKEIVIDYPTTNSNIKELGAKHNYVLKVVRDKSIVLDKDASCLSIEERSVIESEEYNAKVDDILQQIKIQTNNNQPIQFYGDDVTNKVMNLFYSILMQYPTSTNDIQFIINKYIEVVNASNEIDENDKIAIYMGLSVCASSTEFWEEESTPILTSNKK